MPTDELGDTLVLRPSPWKLLLMLAASLGFVTIGVFIMPPDDWTRWLVIGFFGLCAAVFGVQLLPGASYLKLDRDAFTFTALFRATRVEWTDVSSFSTGYVGPNRLVLFDLSDTRIDTTSKRVSATLSRGLTGASGALPDTYGMKPEALAEVMNTWRERALAQRR